MELAFGTDEPLCGQLQIYLYRHILSTHTFTIHTCKEMPFSLINLTFRGLRLVLRQSLVGEGHVALPDFLGWASLVVEGGEVSWTKAAISHSEELLLRLEPGLSLPSPQSCPHTSISNDMQGVGLSR